MRPVSPKALEILSYIKGYQDHNGYTPSLREIAQHFVIVSPSTIKFHLDKLESQGYIERKAGTPRAIKVVDRA